MSLSSYSLLYTDGISSNCFLLLQHRRSATEKGISFVNHVESHRFLNAGQVLSDAAQQLTQYDELLNYILGIIFLATPNFMKVTTAALIAWFRILRSSPRSYGDPEGDLRTIRYYSQTFKNLDIKIPILSSFEGKKTKLTGFFWFAKHEIVRHQPARTLLHLIS